MEGQRNPFQPLISEDLPMPGGQQVFLEPVKAENGVEMPSLFRMRQERKPVGALHGFLGVFRMLAKGCRWRFQDRIPEASIGVLESVPTTASHLDQPASCVQGWWEC